MEVILISIGGALGASLRYVVGHLVRSRSFPWATLTVNVLGSFILGVVLLGASTDAVTLLVGMGFCGAFTTFSSFSYQTVELWEQGRLAQAGVNAIGNLLISLAGYWLAWILLG